MSNFPHWPVRPTGDVFFVKGRIGWRNLRHSDFCADGPHLITGMHIDSTGRVDWNSCFRIPRRKFDESPEIQVKVGDLVITKDGTIGKVARIDWLPGDTSLNAHLFLVRPIQPETCSARFAFHVFTSAAFRNFIETQKSGSTLAGLGEAKFVQFQFPLPTIKEQVLVSDVLDTLDTAIRETESIIDKLKVVKQGLLQDLLTRGVDANGELRPPQNEAPQLYKQSPLGWIPRAWDIEQLGQILAESTRSGLYKPSSFHGRGPLMVQMGGLFNGEAVDFSSATQIQVSSSELGIFGLNIGDLLFARRSLVFEGAGLCVIVRHLPGPSTFESSIIRARVRETVALPEFVCQFLRGKASSAQRRTLIRQVAVSGVSSDDIRQLFIAIPSLSEQELIVDRQHSAQEQINLEQNTVSKLRKQKSGLMNDLLTGRIRVMPLLEASAP